MRLLDRYKYVSHKLIRWWTGYLTATSGLLISAALLVAGEWLFLAGLIGAGVAAVSLGAAFPNSWAGKLLRASEAFFATSVGIFRSMCGDRFQTWNPPASARPGVRALRARP